MSLVKALIVLTALVRALTLLTLMRVITLNQSPLYHIQMVNNLCGCLGLLTRDSEIPPSTDDPANTGATIPLFCQGAVNPANIGIDAPIYPILDLGLISPTNTLVTTLGIQLLPLNVLLFLYQSQHSFYSFTLF